MTPDPHNHTFQLAANYINGTRQSVFLTGRAGTGKTTFLKHIRQHTPKQHMVLAPTGVAAINAGGTTIHSFFQLPFSPFLPVADHGSLPQPDAENTADTHNAYSLIKRVRFNKDKRELLQSLELLIIDEISMVRADVLDAIDTLLRYFRHKPAQPFGGVQMLFIGDMFQLPPVVPNTDWDILQHYYSSPFFFDSQALKQDEPLYIELDKIYRQTDQQFIDALNQVRNNQMDEAGYNLLHSRYLPAFLPQKTDSYVTLCTHNAAADAINDQALLNLKGAAQTYTAEVQGEFNEKSYPAEQQLKLKQGAQVMFIKNDLEKPRRFFNGKIGTVTQLTPDAVTISCAGETSPITIGREEWTNVQYTLNTQQQRIEEKELGSFKQMPLRLAWAITIHKSQGLTFEKAIIDAGKAFAPGQVYVALSRCTSLQGLVLRTAIPASAVFTDPRIVAFGQRSKPAQHLEHQLLTAQYNYQLELLTLCFDGSALLKAAQKLPAILQLHQAGFNPEALPWAESTLAQCQELASTGTKFVQQIQQLAAPPQLPEHNPQLQERLTKAAAWFAPKLSALADAIKKQPAVSDSKDQAETYEEALADVYKATRQWLQLASACSQGFNAEQLLKARSKVHIGEIIGLAYAGSSKRRHEATADNPHPNLMRQLRQLRDAISVENGLPIYMVASTTTIDQMARYLPQSLSDLRKISGFGEVKLAQFGQQFLTVVLDYCTQHHHDGNMAALAPKREKKEASGKAALKGSSKKQSFELFMEGMTIEDIALKRGFVYSTIFGHLSSYALTGEIPVNALLDDATKAQIETAILQFGGDDLLALKTKLPDTVDFNELRLVRDLLVKEGRVQLTEKKAEPEPKL